MQSQQHRQLPKGLTSRPSGLVSNTCGHRVESTASAATPRADHLTPITPVLPAWRATSRLNAAAPHRPHTRRLRRTPTMTGRPSQTTSCRSPTPETQPFTGRNAVEPHRLRAPRPVGTSFAVPTCVTPAVRSWTAGTATCSRGSGSGRGANCRSYEDGDTPTHRGDEHAGQNCKRPVSPLRRA
jgi:hypothetical protein